jgi:hypothetical protein
LTGGDQQSTFMFRLSGLSKSSFESFSVSSA